MSAIAVRTCKGKTNKGQNCQKNPTQGSDFCYYHIPILEDPDNKYETKNIMNPIITLSQLENGKIFIEKAKVFHKNFYNYDKVIYINNSTKVIIGCPEHKDFRQTPNGHLRSGCKKCSEIRITNKRRLTTPQFIERAKLIHNNLYEYDKVDYKNMDKKVIIKCKKHQSEFLQGARNHLSGQGCPICADEKRLSCEKIQLTLEEFVERSKLKHDNFYDYSKVVYKNARSKVTIICPLHSHFDQCADSHMRGRGCAKCGKEWNNEKLRIGLVEYIKRCNIVHNSKYCYNKTIYTNINSDILVTCPKHDHFNIKASEHLYSKRGCKKCDQCPSCGLWRTYGELCEYCKPKPERQLFVKRKELEIVSYLKNNLLDIDFLYNKSVGSEYTDRHLYPDILIKRTHYCIITEIDEYKHKGADYKCDQQRMLDIIAKLGIPCIFIRYNPDNKSRYNPSDKQDLLDKIKEYLYLNEKDKPWDDYGFKVDYLFY